MIDIQEGRGTAAEGMMGKKMQGREEEWGKGGRGEEGGPGRGSRSEMGRE